MNILLIVASVVATAFAQILLKFGVTQVVSTRSFSLQTLLSLCMNVWIIGGLSLFLVSLVMWMYVLSKFEVSYAYPFVSLGLVITVLAGHYMLGESLNVGKIAGVILIVLGILIVSLWGHA